MSQAVNSVTTRRRKSRTTSQSSTSGAGGKDDEEKRKDNTTACLPITFGSIAFYLGKKADEFQTHEWTLYVRGPNHEDLSHCISKVVFQLHASFAQPTREVTSPPYAVTERGWGEFEAQIRIIWKDSTEKPTVVNHGIRLYPPGAPRNTLPTGDKIEPVLSETYDEVVFTNPHESFFEQLTHLRTAPKLEMANQEHMAEFSDEDMFLALVEAQKYLRSELSKAKDRFVHISSELEQTDIQLLAAQDAHIKKQQLQQQQQAAAKARAPTKRSRSTQSKKAKTSASQTASSKSASSKAKAAAAAAAASTS